MKISPFYILLLLIIIISIYFLLTILICLYPPIVILNTPVQGYPYSRRAIFIDAVFHTVKNILQEKIFSIVFSMHSPYNESMQ